MINDKITVTYMNTWKSFFFKGMCVLHIFIFISFNLHILCFQEYCKGRKTKYRSTLILNDVMIDIAAKSFSKFAEESRIMLQTCKKSKFKNGEG